jgi:hypothetical protein
MRPSWTVAQIASIASWVRIHEAFVQEVLLVGAPVCPAAAPALLVGAVSR